MNPVKISGVGSLIVGLFLAGCAPMQPPIATGTTATGSLVIYDKKIPLPPGTWTVRGSATGGSTGHFSGHAGAAGQALTLFNPKGNPFVIVLSTNTGAGRGNGWSLSPWCSRNDLHLRKTRINLQGGNQECWYVTHSRMTTTGRAGPHINQAMAYVRAKRLDFPLTAISVGYRLADIHGFLNVKYYFNPEKEGFNPPVRASFSTSDWHRDRVGAKKSAYIETIKKWGREWLPKVKAGFRGEAIGTGKLVEAAPNPASMPATERLLKLKELFDRKLITPAEYTAKRKSIIDGM